MRLFEVNAANPKPGSADKMLKTHYVSLRLKFSTPVNSREATKEAIRVFKAYEAGGPPAGFKIVRVISR